MTGLADRSTEELTRLREQALKDYEAFRARGLKLDMTRGKPSPEQLDLSLGMLALPGNGDYITENGEDARNYGGGRRGCRRRGLCSPTRSARRSTRSWSAIIRASP